MLKTLFSWLFTQQFVASSRNQVRVNFSKLWFGFESLLLYDIHHSWDFVSNNWSKDSGVLSSNCVAFKQPFPLFISICLSPIPWLIYIACEVHIVNSPTAYLELVPDYGCGVNEKKTIVLNWRLGWLWAEWKRKLLCTEIVWNWRSDQISCIPSFGNCAHWALLNAIWM